MFANRFFEGLESRALMSASPSPLTEAVKLDHDQIHADLLKFRSDMLSSFVTFQNDVTAIKNDGVANATTVLPLINTFFTDLKSMRKQLKGDLLDEGRKVDHDCDKISMNMMHIGRDHRNHDHDGSESDHADLLANRIQLQKDMIAALNARITVRQTFLTTLENDMNAIVTAAQSDPNASAQLVTDLQKAQTDETNRLNTAISDLQKIAADRTQLVADLTAMQTAAG
jgi:hypothetical protein